MILIINKETLTLMAVHHDAQIDALYNAYAGAHYVQRDVCNYNIGEVVDMSLLDYKTARKNDFYFNYKLLVVFGYYDEQTNLTLALTPADRAMLAQLLQMVQLLAPAGDSIFELADIAGVIHQLTVTRIMELLARYGMYYAGLWKALQYNTARVDGATSVQEVEAMAWI